MAEGLADASRGRASVTPQVVSPQTAAATDRAPVAALTSGWQGQLRLRFAPSHGRTRLVGCEHEGPLIVQRVFYPESTPHAPRPLTAAAAAEPCHVYLLHPPGGLVSGDRLQLQVDIERRAHVLLTTPAAGKFYRRRDQCVARAEQVLQTRDGVLEWLPQESLFYPDTSAVVSTIVRLGKRARYIGWEIGCLGWPAVGAALGDGSVRQILELWLDEQPLLLERLCIERAALAPRWGLGGCTAFGTLSAYPARRVEIEAARATASRLNCAEMMLACTIVDGALCCRGLAQRADHLKQAFIDLWRVLRPSLLGRAAVAPRIWAT